MISVRRICATSNAKSVLPTPVGPAITMYFGSAIKRKPALCGRARVRLELRILRIRRLAPYPESLHRLRPIYDQETPCREAPAQRGELPQWLSFEQMRSLWSAAYTCDRRPRRCEPG